MKIMRLTLACSMMLACIAPSLARAESPMTREEKLASINLGIAAAESKETTGLLIAGGGLAVGVLGMVAFHPESSVDFDASGVPYVSYKGTPAVYYLCVVGGGVVALFGAFKWIAAANELSLLKTKRYDVSLSPMPMFHAGGFGGGVALQVRWGGKG